MKERDVLTVILSKLFNLTFSSPVNGNNNIPKICAKEWMK